MAKGWTIGDTSKQYETSGIGPGMVSTGEGDKGGISYGSYQLSTNEGSVQEFLNQSPKYKAIFNGMKPGTTAFSNQWKVEAKKDPEGFHQAQHDFIESKFYNVQVNALVKNGIDLRDRGPAVQDMLWSTSVQYRGLTQTVFTNALKGKDLSKLSDVDIIKSVQDYKYEHNNSLFKSSPKLWDGLKKRAINEKNSLINLAKTYGGDKVNGYTSKTQAEKDAQSYNSATPSKTQSSNLLKTGSKGTAVQTLQEQLNQLGFHDAKGNPLNPDGDFGAKTREAIEAFQRQHGLSVDGKVGAQTLAKIEEQLKLLQPSPEKTTDKLAPEVQATKDKLEETLRPQLEQQGVGQKPADAMMATCTCACVQKPIPAANITQVVINTDNNRIIITTNSPNLFISIDAVQASRNNPETQYQQANQHVEQQAQNPQIKEQEAQQQTLAQQQINQSSISR